MTLEKKTKINAFTGPAVIPPPTAPPSAYQRQGYFEKIDGATRYKVNIFTGGAAREKLDDKIIRLITNDALNSNLWPSIKPPRTGEALERDSV